MIAVIEKIRTDFTGYRSRGTHRKLLYTVLLILILGAGSYLRFHGMTREGMWLDELHTMNEANPDKSLGETYHYLWYGMDPHPPLYFTVAYAWFNVFGYNDFASRLFSVITGIISIYAMYLLGRELHNRRAGLIAALLTAINYYNLYYSQESRNYILSFLFAVLSFYTLARLLKQPSPKTGLLYGLTTLLLLYSHYYGFVVLGAQLFIFPIFLVTDAANRKKLFWFAALAGGVILVGYAPWIKAVLYQTNRDSMWIGKPESNFFISYFDAYFGNSPALVYTFTLAILFFLVKAMGAATPAGADASRNRLYFSFTLLFTWIVVSYLIPYVRSLVSLPMLYSRYTIVTLPAFLLMAAIGIELLAKAVQKWLLLGFIVAVTLINLYLEKDYYNKPTKEQWREMIAHVVGKNASAHPILTDRGWHMAYYFEQHNFKPTFITKDTLKQYEAGGIWVVTGHGGNPLDEAAQQHLDQHYRLRNEYTYTGIDTWSKLYLRRGPLLTLSGGDPTADGTRVLWGNGSFQTQPVTLRPGHYELLLNGYGTKVGPNRSHVNVYLNDKQLTSHLMADQPSQHAIPFDLKETTQVQIRVEFDNDYSDPRTGEDRNVFMQSIEVNHRP
ncbi:MAG: glycosyltransferase family 39 protein [Cytophagales bacterium]|nr:glycosyltransferase family 39 protein [Cytophagales bacterium]